MGPRRISKPCVGRATRRQSSLLVEVAGLALGLGEVAGLGLVSGVGTAIAPVVGVEAVALLLLHDCRLTACTNPTIGVLMPMKPLGCTELSDSVTCSSGARSLKASLVVSADL